VVVNYPGRCEEVWAKLIGSVLKHAQPKKKNFHSEDINTDVQAKTFWSFMVWKHEVINEYWLEEIVRHVK